MSYTNKDLVDVIREKAPGYLSGYDRNERILEALLKIDRRKFISYRKTDIATVDWNQVDKLQDYISSGIDIDPDFEDLNELVDNFQYIVEEATAISVNGEKIVYDLDIFVGFLIFSGKLIKDMEQPEPYSELFENLKNVFESLDFYKENVRNLSYVDKPLPIGEQQTCSQPSMVAFMADVLNLEPGMDVYEIGTGCGYSGALAATLIDKGSLVTAELIPMLARAAKRNINRYVRTNPIKTEIKMIEGDGKKIYEEKAPYDRIYLTAGINDGFDSSGLREYLTNDGLLLYPEEDGLMILENKKGDHLAEYRDVSFVPLI